MTAIRKRAGKEAKSYKQMHLLNDNVFGPGELWNLTPGPAQSNSEMEHGVETLLKRAIVDKALVLDFEAQVHYRNDPMVPTQGELDQDPDKYRFDRITFKAKQYDFDGAQWAGSKSPDSDVAAINKASSTVYWKWGSLTPLRAKPSVLTTTDVNELAGVMPKGLAARIVALNTYNNKNPGSPYDGHSEQGQERGTAERAEGLRGRPAQKKEPQGRGLGQVEGDGSLVELMLPDDLSHAARTGRAEEVTMGLVRRKVPAPLPRARSAIATPSSAFRQQRDEVCGREREGG